MIVGYAYVVGDILHVGHLLHLRNCKRLCDRLIVGVLTDEATMEKKKRPAIPFEQRIELVSALRWVDAAVTQETYSPANNIHDIKPDLLFESSSHGDIPPWSAFADWDLRVVTMPYYPSESSTHIKETIREAD